MKIICPLRIVSFSDFLEKIQKVAGRADVVELWLDQINDIDKFLLDFSVWKNLQKPKEIFLAVCKMPNEKGFFSGLNHERVLILQKFIKATGELIDLDVTRNTNPDIAIISPRNLILSFHDFEGMPNNLMEIFSHMQKFQPQIYKFAVTTNHQTELDDFLNFVENFPKNKNSIFTTMGKLGKQGREQIGTKSWGGFWALDKEHTTAVGQKTLDDLF